MSTAIKVESLSKAYQIGQIGTGTISRDLERWFVTKVLGREDPFMNLGRINDRTVQGDTDVIWSLRDVNLDVEQGEAVGIIGRNGAGKSTLLKLLSRVTIPTTGRIKIKGRVSSLLEVGTGFHPELTGRENVYLNGSILGMRKREIDRKFDEIVDFSGVERYIDTPVKRYSSGMSVRLAFAVAAYLESEILVVDEVLAVGDAEFQKKCLTKMNEVSSEEGRTVLFVSHNMAAVHSLCDRGVLIDSGQVKCVSTAAECINEYAKVNNTKASNEKGRASATRRLQISGVRINDELMPVITPADGFSVSADLHSKGASNPTIILLIDNANGHQVVHCRTFGEEVGLDPANEQSRVVISLPPLWLAPGVYSVYLKLIASTGPRVGRGESERIMLQVKEEFDDGTRGILAPKINWGIDRLAPAKSETFVY